MMTDSELFLQNWLQTVSVFQGVIKHMLINILIIELKDLRGSAEQYITGSSDTSPPCSLRLFNKVHSEDCSCIVQHMGTVKMFPLWLS